MLWEYIKAVFHTALDFSRGGVEVIEIAIALVFLFVPGWFKKFEDKDITFEQSFRKLLLHKFITNDKWRYAIVLIGLFIFHILVIAQYRVYKNTETQFNETTNQIAFFETVTNYWLTDVGRIHEGEDWYRLGHFADNAFDLGQWKLAVQFYELAFQYPDPGNQNKNYLRVGNEPCYFVAIVKTNESQEATDLAWYEFETHLEDMTNEIGRR